MNSHKMSSSLVNFMEVRGSFWNSWNIIIFVPPPLKKCFLCKHFGERMNDSQLNTLFLWMVRRYVMYLKNIVTLNICEFGCKMNFLFALVPSSKTFLTFWHSLRGVYILRHTGGGGLRPRICLIIIHFCPTNRHTKSASGNLDMIFFKMGPFCMT